MKHNTNSHSTPLKSRTLLISFLGLFAALFTASPSSLKAQGGRIDFESDAPGIYSSFFRSTSDNSVSFFNGTPILPDWQVGLFGPNSRGTRSLATLGPASDVRMNFSSPINRISFYYGGDDGSLRGSGVTRVTMTLFLNGIQIREVIQTPNFNNRLDQRISISGPSFDRVVFAFTDNAGRVTSAGDEVIDDIVYGNGGGGGGGGNEVSDGSTRDPSLTRKQQLRINIRNLERRVRKARRKSNSSLKKRLNRRLKRLKRIYSKL